MAGIERAPGLEQMPRIFEVDVVCAFTLLFQVGLKSATAELLNHYTSIVEVAETPSSASGPTTVTPALYSLQLTNQPSSALRTRGDALVQISRGVDKVVVSSIAIEYKRDIVHHSLTKEPTTSRGLEIPTLDHTSPVPLQNLETEHSVGPDAVATKAIIQCVTNSSRFFLLISIPFFQIGELIQHSSSNAAAARDFVPSTSSASTSSASTSSASTSTSTTIAPSTTEQSARSLVEGRYSIILQELTRWVQPSPSTFGDAARAETLGIDLPMGSLAVSFFALTFDAVKAAPSPTRATVQRLVAATSRPSTQVRPAPDSDSEGRDDTYGARRTAKARKISSGANATRRASNTPQGRARANDSSKPRTPPASDQSASAVLSSDPETPAGRCFTSAPTSAGWSPTTSPLPGLCLEPKSITVTKDRQFEIKASLSNGHWSTMSYTGTSRVDLVEIEFNIVSSVSSASPLSSRRSPNPSQASEFIKGLHLSDAVLQWLAENPMEELTDDRIPLGLSDRFESTADLRLEKLVGTGSTAGGWLANVIRTNRPSESPDTKFPLVDDPVLNKTYFLKLVSCQFAGSVIRETLFYQQVFPHLPDHLRCYLPRYHGTYRGSNGNGYAMVFENVGKHMNERDYYGSPGQWWEIEEAFAQLGIIHNDISAGNVLIRPNDGGFYLVDWGRSYLKPRV